MSAAAAQVARQDWRGNNLKTVWYNCKNYRANLLWLDGRLLRDLTKFDDRYQERYLTAPCGGWLATYDNLPIVDSRIWSGENGPCALSLQKEAVAIRSAEQTETVLCVSVTFQDGTPGEETKLTFADGKLCGSHNGFAYAVGVDAQIMPQPGGALLKTQNGSIRLQMDIRMESSS